MGVRDQLAERYGPDPERWPSWWCGRCGQRNAGWVAECGRCERQRTGPGLREPVPSVADGNPEEVRVNGLRVGPARAKVLAMEVPMTPELCERLVAPGGAPLVPPGAEVQVRLRATVSATNEGRLVLLPRELREP
jgi:hypothetical protein